MLERPILLPFASFVLVAASPAEQVPAEVGEAEGKPHSHIHSGGDIEEAHGPILLQTTYTGEVMGNVSGGRKRGARYLDNFDLVFEADLEQIAGWSGAQLHVYGLYNNGQSISSLVGDAQGVSNIETGVSSLRLYEAWIDQKFGSQISLKVGLYDLNTEFDALDAAGLFVSSPHGIGTDFAQSGENGPSIFPVTSLAARLEVTPAEGWAIRTALLDGVPGDPERPAHTAIRLGDGDGALVVGEVEGPIGDGKLLVGHWRYTAAFDRTDGVGRAKGNAGSYVRAELPLLARGHRRIDGFVRVGSASERFNMFGGFAGGGLRFRGWVPGRDEDEFGIAFAAAFTSDSYRRTEGAEATEFAIETTYRTQLTQWLSLQPSLHYIRNPSAAPDHSDAIVAGLRFEISYDLLGM